jgi:HD-like signal output (HDOD) protein
MPDTESTAAKPTPMRMFGRFELRQLLGKSARSMAWLAFDPRSSQEVMLTMPRAQPADGPRLEAWKRDTEQAARLNHPNLAHVVEIGVQDHWPYITVDRALGQTLGERLDARPPAPSEAVEWLIQILQGLAFAHQSGLAHGDVQMHQVVVSEQGVVRVMALGAAGSAPVAPGVPKPDAHGVRNSQLAAQRDVLALGVLMHHLLAGQPALDEPDTSKVIERLPPTGGDVIRLPWSTPQPIAEGLRAIANRATERQERQRYHNARTLLTALSGWREAAANGTGGPLALLLDRVRSIGHLPTLPGVGARVARVAMSEGQRTDEMAEQILQDMALSFELIRNVNSAMVQGTQSSGTGPVLTLRRAIALVGLKGVRQAAASLRGWPGPLSEVHAAALLQLMDRVRLAGHLAQVLRPAGYDPEVVYLISVLQNLSRLMVQYHFPEEAEQILQLMQTLPPPQPGEPEMAGMSEESASFAVLGVDSETLGAAVARQWGLSDEVLHMVRRLPVDRPVRVADSDGDVLRQVASASNEVIDIMTRLPAAKVASALAGVAQRYGRALDVSPRQIGEALQSARAALSGGGAMAASMTRAAEPAEPAAQAEAAPSEFARVRASRNAH